MLGNWRTHLLGINPRKWSYKYIQRLGQAEVAISSDCIIIAKTHSQAPPDDKWEELFGDDQSAVSVKYFLVEQL